MIRSVIAGVAATLCSTLANASLFTIDVTGIESWDSLDSPNNTSFIVDLAAEVGLASGTAVIVDAVGFDVTVEAFSPSWLSEATVALERLDLADGLFLSPGIGEDFPGTGSYSSGGLIDLVSEGLDFTLDDGLLAVQFFEGFDDVVDAVDAIWVEGTIDISAVEASSPPVPAPAVVWLLGVGLLGLAGMRRKAR